MPKPVLILSCLLVLIFTVRLYVFPAEAPILNHTVIRVFPLGMATSHANPSYEVINTEAVGNVPVAYGDKIVFFTVETDVNEDLDNDGEIMWPVIRYYDISEQRLVNTGVDGHYPAIHRDIVTFTGRPIKYYNLSEGKLHVTDTDVLVDIPSVWENTIAFPCYEQNVARDLNGDGDMSDSVILYYDILKNELVNTRLTGWGVSIYKDIIAYSSSEFQVSYYNITSKILTNTGVTGWWPSFHRNIIAFESFFPVGAPTYTAMAYYNISDHALVDTKIDGRMATVGDDIIVVSSPEGDSGVGDLNHDGDTYDWVIQFYNMTTGVCVNTGVEGVHPSICGNLVAFETAEQDFGTNETGTDLNNDGDTADAIIQYMYVGPQATRATFDVQPDILNLRSKGACLTGYIDLPEDYSLNDVDFSSIRINNTVPADLGLATFEDNDNDSKKELAVGFNRTKVIELVLSEGIRHGSVVLTASGRLRGGISFEGSAVIKTKMPGDVNCDGKVDISDISMVESAFGSYIGHSRWNCATDENEDNRTDILDLALTVRNYGKTYL